MAPPPLPEDPRDAEHIRLLVVFHYVAVGLGVVGLLFLVFHFLFLRSIFGLFEELPDKVNIDPPPRVMEQPVDGANSREEGASAPPVNNEELQKQAKENAEAVSEFFGGFFESFAIFYVVAGVLLLIMIVLNLMSAGSMSKRKCKTFSMVVAGLNCLFIPLGTILGVFTLVVLSRASIETTYRSVKGI